jgi:glucokinase
MHRRVIIGGVSAFEIRIFQPLTKDIQYAGCLPSNLQHHAGRKAGKILRDQCGIPAHGDLVARGPKPPILPNLISGAHWAQIGAARSNGDTSLRNSEPAARKHILLGDIGATNARFALLSDGVLGPVDCFSVADFVRFTDAVNAFLNARLREIASVTSALLAAAGPVERDRCVLTNCPWTIEANELRTSFGFEEVRLFNDFEATARSLSYLGPSDLYPLGGGRAVSGAPTAVLGPGTGLGVACLVPGSQTCGVIAGEGGHATMAATNPREDTIIAYLRQRFEHVSAERVVSGSELENLYGAVATLDEVDAPKRDAAEITAAALEGNCRPREFRDIRDQNESKQLIGVASWEFWR